MPSPHPYAYEHPREPVYRDDFNEARLRHAPPPERQRTRRRHDLEPPQAEERPRRRRPQREMRPPSSMSDSESPPPPPRRHQSQRERRPREYEGYDSYDDRHIPSRRPPELHRRNDGYVSDNRYNRPRRDMYDDRFDDAYQYGPRRVDRPRYPPHDERERVLRDPRRDERYRDERYREAPRSRPKPQKSATPRWQKEAKNMFVEYAVPVIKAEGGKYLSKQIGNFMAKK